jgi:ubiquinone/menaquinone biosynthesis C-methylase UbiE
MTQDDSQSEKNTYLLDPESPDEMARLLTLDRFLTKAMGGPLASIPELPERAHILDLACGPGGWAIDVASKYPSSEVVGVDISHIMTDYARISADIRKVSNVSFALADVTKTLPFSDGTFDIVNARFLVAVLPRKAWQPFISECTRVLRPQGVLLLTEAIDYGVTNSPAFERMQALTARGIWQASYGFSVDGRTVDVSFMLPHLLRNVGYSDIQHIAYALEFSAGTDAWADVYHNLEISYKLGQTSLVKAGLVSAEEIEHLYQRMLIEMKQDDFCAMTHFMSTAAIKP